MPEPRIHVDFNGIQEDGRLFALRRHADAPDAIQPGSPVELWDEDGNIAQGRVISLEDRDLVQIEVVLDSWTVSGDAPVAEQPDMPRLVADQALLGAIRRPGAAAAASIWHIVASGQGGIVVILDALDESAAYEAPEDYFSARSVTVGAAAAPDR